MNGPWIVNFCQILHTQKLNCVSKNDTDIAHYNFNTHQPILVIFGTDIAE